MNKEIELPPKTKRDWIIFIMFAVVLLALIFIILKLTLFSGYHGAYSEVTKTYWCDSWSACLHEIGHKTDHQLNWISCTEEFRNALIDFSKGEHPWSKIMLEQRGRNIKEIYAELLEASMGFTGMPEELRKFYDWNFINQEISWRAR